MNAGVINWDDVVARALAEDLGSGDVTVEVLELKDRLADAAIIAKSDGVLFGMEGVRRVFAALDRRVFVQVILDDGQKFEAGRTVARLHGPAGPILSGERTALNFLQQLSGVATLTAAFIARVDNPAVAVLDTRKTVLGIRMLQKAAVAAGGGENHRMGLYDGIMIKDNHKRLCGGVGKAIEAARSRRRPHIPIMAEVETAAEAAEAAAAGADVIMLDNFTPAAAAEACRLIGGRAAVEVTGGVNLGNTAAFARTGVTRISIGALTHSAPAADFSLEITSLGRGSI